MKEVEDNTVVWNHRHRWDFTIKEYCRSLCSDLPQSNMTNEMVNAYLFKRVLETNANTCNCYRPCECGNGGSETPTPSALVSVVGSDAPTSKRVTVTELFNFLKKLPSATEETCAALFVDEVDKDMVVWDRALWDFTIQEYVRRLRTDPPRGGITVEYLFKRILETNAEE
jgi:hypothetical protein